jgi:hypothetical protein
MAEPSMYERAKVRVKALLTPRRPATDEEAEKARAGAEEANKALPSWLSGRDAVLRKREQLRKLDEQTRE